MEDKRLNYELFLLYTIGWPIFSYRQMHYYNIKTKVLFNRNLYKHKQKLTQEENELKEEKPFSEPVLFAEGQSIP